MTDECRLFIAFFSKNIPVFDSLFGRNGHFDESGYLLHAVRRVRPNEPKEVTPTLKIFPREAPVAPEERFE